MLHDFFFFESKRIEYELCVYDVVYYDLYEH
ncbi:hypothetical protein FHS57_001642 [Runella defluvii]|uniref:Uncharacterized protein n=1 Tax=Runella defluvii TaxID=370973 RepID=A0A7W6EPI6_9BACT|nr:hypothetical protein [Runella defluvii]